MGSPQVDAGGLGRSPILKMTELDEIERLLDLMDERDLEELEVEREGLHIRLRKRPRGGAPARPADAPAAPPSAAAAGDEAADEGLRLVKSPIVGTFYRAPEPGARPFVEVGSAVRKGQVLCVIEAMKLMNEIDAEHDGEVVEVFAEDRQPVQYGEKLFAIRPRQESAR